ncbi:MAG: DUF4065 domain-containing protein [Oscillospiraceae bacterium]|jgi:uncharacterized phage-associated protein|nr:DUF4065 domain-containing protein [Oscillospiraceae bacterium]
MSKELNIAMRYFINELKPDTLKLQKLLYFAQGVSFCMNDSEFFSEQFEAWVHGPVIPSVYHQYKKYGYNPINITYSIGDMSGSQQEVLKYVKDNYGKYDGKYLEELTHSQDPWKYARSGLDPDERVDKNIPKEIIAEYFIGLMFQPGVEVWE